MISKRPSGAITSRSAATIGAILATSLRAGSTIEKSGGRAAIARAMFGNPPQSAGSSRESEHCRRYHPVDCIESNRATAVVDAIGNTFPHLFNLKLQGEAVFERAGNPPARPQADGNTRQFRAPAPGTALQAHSNCRRSSFPATSFWRDAGPLDEGPPFFHFGLLQGTKRLRGLLAASPAALPDRLSLFATPNSL